MGIMSLMHVAPCVFQVPSMDQSKLLPASPALILGVPRSYISLALQLELTLSCLGLIIHGPEIFLAAIYSFKEHKEHTMQKSL